MKIFGIIGLLVIIAGTVWFLGKHIEALQVGKSNPGVYQEAIDSAKDVANQVSKKTEEKVQEVTTPSGTMITVYDGVSVSSGTKTLDMSGKGYTGSLKGEVRFLTELRDLDLSDNKFTGLPAEVGQLSKLETLNLSNNPFTGLPQELGNLKNLKTLDLRGTQYSPQDLEVIKKGLPATTQILVD
jgi:Leucine-rich repeat (LRR) protein